MLAYPPGSLHRKTITGPFVVYTAKFPAAPGSACTHPIIRTVRVSWLDYDNRKVVEDAAVAERFFKGVPLSDLIFGTETTPDGRPRNVIKLKTPEMR
jgi:hypothetical protein